MKEMFYLTMHSTHFCNCDDIGSDVVSDLSYERGNPRLTISWTTFSNQQGINYMQRSTDMLEHTTTFVAPVVEIWL